MKISKDSHKRMTVVINSSQKDDLEGKTIGQITPLNQQLKRYVEERVKNVKSLYKVLGVSANPTSDKTKSQMVLHYFNNFMNLMFKEVDKQGKEMLAKAARENAKKFQNRGNQLWLKKFRSVEKQYINDINMDISDEFVHELVALYLRGSLKKEIKIKNPEKKVYIPDVIEKLIIGVCREKNFEKYMKKIPLEELQVCLEVIFRDYTKEKWIDEIVRSIENQDVKAQAFGDGENCRIKIANADDDHKKYIFEFMVDYACGTEERRKSLLGSIQKLILLFLCGEEVYSEVRDKEIALWSFDALEKRVSNLPKVFDDQCEELLLEREKLDGLLKESRNSAVKQRIKDIDVEVKRRLHREITEKYHKSVHVLESEIKNIEGDEYKRQRFWVEYIEHETEKKLLLAEKKRISLNKINIEWLYKAVWKSFVAFMASKFVDQGKAVYHFAMPDLHQIQDGKAVKIGAVQPQYQSGITSFDYERITAEERLERRFIVAIMFAVNNFASAVCPNSVYERNGNMEDILQFSDHELIQRCYANAGWRLMQYFGGCSQWEKQLSVRNITIGEERNQFITEIKAAFNRIRNMSFHYTSTIDAETLSQDSPLVWIFEKEQEGVGELIRKKYYSNNVPMFYSVNNIDLLMNRIYRNEMVIESQIPSFQNVLGWKDYIDNIKELIDHKAYAELQKDKDIEITKIFHNSFYFIMKEFYYRRFLQEKDLMKRFEDVLETEHKNAGKNSQKTRAIENFQKRMKEYKKQNTNLEFGEFCQLVMTDYNLQNTQKKVRSNRNDKLPEPIYEHFKMLLLEGIRKAFLNYVNEEIMGKAKEGEFLRTPHLRTNIVEEKEFCSSWTTKVFEDLEKDKYDAWLIYWFIASHFMNSKQLNHLKGTIKGYLSYISGIDNRRCAAMRRNDSEAEKERKKDIKDKQEQYKKLLRVLDLASEYCGKISANWEDYYETEEEYAKSITSFLKYEKKDVKRSLHSQLHDFCNMEMKDSPSGYIGMFYDGKRPILNRNVVQARLYGTEKVIAKCLEDDKVTKQEIIDYYKQAKKLNTVFKTGVCKNLNQEQDRRKYQQMKNRIELVDVLKYSEILNDLMSQLVSWCYLRERDWMYFQLGLHYIRLYFGKDLVCKDSKFRVLKGAEDGCRINITDGALLYQLAAIYTYELPVYKVNKAGEAVVSKNAPSGSPTAKGVNGFYIEYCEKDASVYDTGVELFYDPSTEKELIEFRNYIDHSKYFSRRDRSMLEMYSTMYAIFFQHDMKLKKSVTVSLQNILARHFVLASIDLAYDMAEKTENIKDGTKENRKVPKIEIKKLNSEVTVHKYKITQEGGRVREVTKKLDYYDQRFLERMRRILEYKEIKEVK
ncbi:MAG: type VI-A CRISPR-associated RNA-guided ribonuclease Cas13a [Eubacterium sp.]|nr:type VI-A CRISPR-associated RNA-guided ribonuclease Cas13a [Eubacterium sp.]